MRARLAAGASAVGDDVDEALQLFRTGDLAILAGAAGYMLGQAVVFISAE